jgi:hypothetical protein
MTRWNKNNCHQEALKYLYKRDFKKNSYGIEINGKMKFAHI